MDDFTLTISTSDGEVIVTQDDEIKPFYDPRCFTPEAYVERVAEMGLAITVTNPDGSHTYRRISPHCICNVTLDVGP